jgi:RNA polymerase-binding transcription factor DksA
MQQKTKEKCSAAVAFTMDDVRDVLRARKLKQLQNPLPNTDVGKTIKRQKQRAAVCEEIRVREEVTKAKQEVAAVTSKRTAVSILDILGFDPNERNEPECYDVNSVPEKWRAHFAALAGMRDELRMRLSQHRDETLQPNSTGTGMLPSALRQSNIDCATEHLDLERSLCFVENEGELLREVEDAIDRIFCGTYGVCEQTGDAIDAKRLAAVPFTRYSLRGQEEHEKKLTERRHTSELTFQRFDGEDIDALTNSDDDEMAAEI